LEELTSLQRENQTITLPVITQYKIKHSNYGYTYIDIPVESRHVSSVLGVEA
jgi:hypothetical protein